MKTTNEEVLKEFERDIALYNKYLDTTRAIIALRDYKKYCETYDIRESDDTVIDYFARKIIDNLEDPKMKISYKGKISTLSRKIDSLYEKIKDKYKEVIYEEVLSSRLDRINTFYTECNSNYNFALDIVGESMWARWIFNSNMSISKRQNMFIDMMKKDSDVIYSLRLFNLCAGSKKDYESNLRELRSSMEKPEFLRKVLKEAGIDYVKIIIDTGIVRAYSTIFEDILKDEKANLYISLLRKIYDSSVYQESASPSQKATDLRNIISILPIGAEFEKKANEVIKFDFDTNPYVFDAFAKKIVSSWDRLYNPDIVRKEIADKLLNKAKNEEDKERLLKHYNKFLEETDIKGQRAKLKQERRRQKLILKASRQEFTSLLRNLNDKLQEEVPGEKILKDIDFKKLS